MRVFVTGGSGQVGRELARVVPADQVYLATHQTDDVSDPRIVDTIRRERPDVVIHAAAMTDVDGCERNPQQAYLINETGSRLVARGAAAVGARLIAISTDYVFDGTKGAAYVESDVPNPKSVYGASKLAGERAVYEELPSTCVARTSWVFGEGKSHFITFVLNRLRQGEPVRAVADKFGSPTSTKDLVAAILQLAHANATGLFHVAGTGVCNWVEYAEWIRRTSDVPGSIEPIAFADLQRPAARPAHSALTSERLSGVGIVLRPWQEMVSDYLQTYEQRPLGSSTV
ncbi:MAG: dTDP-4-dehydrorhamnose reductase [Nitrospiraceae bacterium]